MCLIALALDCHPAYPLVLIANRDELHARAAAPAGPDPQYPDVHGGRDLAQGGGWLMASRRGRLAAVTNVRVRPLGAAHPRSRGALVRGFVSGADDVDAWLDAIAPAAGDYGPFNLVLWGGACLAFAGNHPRFARHPVAPGLHAVSNGAFDAPWPKSTRASQALARWLENGLPADARAADVAPLLDALADTTPAPDAALPDTGIGLALERTLSPPFVRDPRYGTRCSTVVLVQADGIRFVERRFGAAAQVLGQSDAWLPRIASR
ncbi:NRDE family protein [Cognatiluteimonas weifangensis]|uniref:NRDE family protein n=1 Tax=Cognatiluteimonas weifangensis TaxID=2303539 RepID=A0A372DQD0_9GAMM|nr:NRDE family protein [Luteimonas weifangensis]RFP61562.1 NRDE family protein [Luteimonas weifangensis]